MSSGATKTFAQSLIINEGMSSQPVVGLFFKSLFIYLFINGLKPNYKIQKFSITESTKIIKHI